MSGLLSRCSEINNEIVSGERLSGIAARARRELVEAMATRAEEESWALSDGGLRSLFINRCCSTRNCTGKILGLAFGT